MTFIAIQLYGVNIDLFQKHKVLLVETLRSFMPRTVSNSPFVLGVSSGYVVLWDQHLDLFTFNYVLFFIGLGELKLCVRTEY